MRLNDRTDLAFRILMVLATKRERCTATELAEWLNAPLNHLVKVVQVLQREGWVSTTRGRSGGIDLVTDPDTLTAGTVVRQVEASFELVECFRDQGECPLESSCSLANAIAGARDAFLRSLDAFTIAELTHTSRRVLLRVTA